MRPNEPANVERLEELGLWRVILIRGPRSSRERVYYVTGPPFEERRLFWSCGWAWSVGRYEFGGFIKDTRRTVAYRCLKWRHFTPHENRYYRNVWPKPGLEPADGLGHQINDVGRAYVAAVMPNDPWTESYWVRRGLPVPPFVYTKGKRRTALILNGQHVGEYLRTTEGAKERRDEWQSARWLPDTHGPAASSTGSDRRGNADDRGSRS